METGHVKLRLNGQWNLIDLSLVTRVYTQIYGLLYSLNTNDNYIDDDITSIYIRYPWAGGYSAVNFYRDLYYKIPHRDRPEIKSIQYNSPGFIELSETVQVASDIAKIVGCVCAAVLAGNKTYNIIQKNPAKHALKSL